ncbi:MAG: cell division protein ZapD [Candidatus Methylopumilus sp.]|nr:cell division protein ZapD [Candidatus Methylopumilus sp.]
MTLFEFPLNERTRRLLRIEEIYKKFEFQLKNSHDYFEFSCFNTLFEIVQLVSRSDIKIDFLQELERQEKKHLALTLTEGLKEGKLDPTKVISKIKIARKKLESMDVKPGFNFNNNLFLEQIKKRITAPGGLLNVDFPNFNDWVCYNSKKYKLESFKIWAQPLIVFKETSAIILSILRNQYVTELIKLKSDKYQKSINPLKTFDLIMIQIPTNLRIIPEISANKYTVNFFFYHFNKNLEKEPTKLNFKFSYALASL